MLILALDTASEWGGAGIFRDAECLAAVRREGPANYSVALFEMVEELRERTGVQLREIDLFAVANGPGSFTGIRVGLAAAQGWAAAFETPARGVSVLEALIEEAHPETEYALAVLDARRAEVYAGLFRRASADEGDSAAHEGGWAVVSEGVALQPRGLVSYLERQLPGSASLTCVARESDTAAGALQEPLPKSIHWKKTSDFLVPAIARLAWRDQLEGKPFSIQDVSAYYIRRCEAEMNWKD
ncbi:MAG TPA: tRNA (adenosine(37)-N6)-threonylcarbamoyltransferase complex dimerization subunit type 1 TsaB [Terriglobia bacterium]|nr:tRNA (adenosine(37)-N6)-threonylcarbamoyltransferase complex dimerization subunit type 1 TsaB [Terriglobia bacterium]